MLWVDALQLLLHKSLVVSRGYYPYMINIYDAIKAVEGLLYHCSTLTRDVDKLLWFLWGGHWPESATYATCHYDEMFCHDLFNNSFLQELGEVHLADLGGGIFGSNFGHVVLDHEFYKLLKG